MAANLKETRRWLNSYKILKKTVKLKEKHLNDFIVDMHGPLKLSISRNSKKNPDDTDALSLLIKIDNIYTDIINDLKEDILKTKALMQEIIDTINALDNNTERCLCFCRFIMCYSWSEASLQLGYEERQCQRHVENAIKKIAATRN